jgi:cytochrome bd-type quinol oxidase subunit 2
MKLQKSLISIIVFIITAVFSSTLALASNIHTLPLTGDYTYFTSWIIIAALALIIICICIVLLITKNRKKRGKHDKTK